MREWTIGDKALCLDDQFHESHNQRYVAMPVKGRIYTVRDVLLGVAYTPKGTRGTVRLLFDELHNPWAGKTATTERGFDARRFRRPDELTTEDETPQAHPRQVKVPLKLVPA